VTTPQIAVLIPCYRQARYLGEAVASVRAQTFRDWECAIVASDPESAARARELARDEPRIRVVEHPPSGVADARNVAALATSAPLLLPLDADDTIAPTFVERTRAAIGTRPFAIAHADTRVVGRVEPDWCPTWSAEGVRAQNCLPIASLHTRALFEAVGGWDVSLGGYEDWAYWIACSKYAPTVTRIGEPLFLYRQHADSRRVALDPWDGVWRAMIRERNADLYPSRNVAKDEATIAGARELLGRLRAQLAQHPDCTALAGWVRAIEGPELLATAATGISATPTLIPRLLHHIWIGPKRMPVEWMRSWPQKHLGWRHCVWRQHDAGWILQDQIDRMGEWNGKADLMRYEILWRFGGVALDADSVCERSLDEGDFLTHEAFTSFSNEAADGDLLACAAMGGRPGAEVWRRCIEAALTVNMRDAAWRSVGPGLLTAVARGLPAGALHVYPSRTFCPTFHRGNPAPGNHPIFARQLWASTKGLYEDAR
jgi:glycosyltransferase involved in cell wall biosynthesis